MARKSNKIHEINVPVVVEDEIIEDVPDEIIETQE